MLIRNTCSNLGDFSNALPVISGLSKCIGQPIDLVIPGEMKKFKGIKELLGYQQCIATVEFDHDVFSHGKFYERLIDKFALNLSSWTRMDQNDPNRPIETCRFENWINDNYGIHFNVDDDFLLDIPYVLIEDTRDKHVIGDRWNHPTVDKRRLTNVIRDGANLDPQDVVYLDYEMDLIYNLNMIKSNPNAFITTFTGIGILADLMDKETLVCWDEDMRIWDGQTVEFDFRRHYYANRKSKLVYVKDLQIYRPTN